MVLCVIDYAKLAWSHTMYLAVGMDNIGVFTCSFKRCRQIFGSMTYLERDAFGQFGQRCSLRTIGRGMEIMYLEVLLIRRFRVITMTDIQDIMLHILFNNKPRTAAKAEALTLPNRVKPQSFVLTYLLSTLQFNDIAHAFA